ncbi:hypothetical protein DOJK_01937 [Patescibacteria group bacterium]|nr:hypothetical protein DOJK_01937 [Patescibacteria group bacterium]
MIFIQRSSEPDILINKGKTEQRKLCTAYEQDQRKFEFDNKIYGHESVKTELKLMQHNKCCFCESKVSHVDYGDVEHYRPKGAYQQSKSDKLSESGYYWLAYTWNNLLFCCAICNQQYKKNLFPLLDDTKRARNHHNDITQEEPLLINPSSINPEEHIGFREQIAYPIKDSIYGKTTIDTLGLNREQLKEKRFTELAEIEVLIDLLKALNTQANHNTVEVQNTIKQTEKYLKNKILPSAEYSAMVKSYLSSITQI